MERNKRISTQTMVMLAVFSALAYVSVALIRIPVVQFLKYEPKDVILLIGSFLYGPSAGLLMSVAVALVEMVTISDTGWIGALMNMLSSCTFVCTAALIYRRHRTAKGAVQGLIVGGLGMVVIMLLWNALITPLYMGVPREAVLEMLLPVFLPFNLLKGVMNSAITLLLYKHVVTALRKARLLPPSAQGIGKPRKHHTLILSAVSMLLLASAILTILVWQGIL